MAVRAFLTTPVLIDMATVLYILGILTGMSVGFWAGRIH